MHTNRLAKETSPYLLQHQHNPVDWYPWGPEAFAAAREQNKPIFLSVGYSTCYWCHVMERQSFENEAIAAEMNRTCICIKVDREERPDVDQLYMTAVQVLTRHGGWPMNVFLTPDLKPFYGGTYFPPTDMHSRPGMPTLLRSIEDAWKNRRDAIDESANNLVRVLQSAAKPQGANEPFVINKSLIARMIEQSTDDFDDIHGGFGGAPKFPRQTLLELVNQFIAATPVSPATASLRRKLEHSLEMMYRGGIRDQLGGAFHRYSTDAKWLIPHFEIMLYDNAMLAPIYADASRLFSREDFARVARGICDFILREMTGPSGAFYTAIDAEVDAQEGLSYLWTREEIDEILGADSQAFCDAYGLSDGPNFADPHHGPGFPDKNVLYLPARIDSAADAKLAPLRGKLKAVRDLRKQPITDTKIITGWNAMMISALSRVGTALQDQTYSSAAARAADFILKNHLKQDGSLARTSRDGIAKHAGCLDDYASLAQSLLDLFDATKDPKWLAAAKELASAMIARFADENGGFFFTQATEYDLIIRQKIATDSPLPAGAAVATRVLLRLDDVDRARKSIVAFAPQLLQYAAGMSSFLLTTMEFVQTHGEIEITASADAGGDDDESNTLLKLSASEAGERSVDLMLEIASAYHINAHETAANLVATSVSTDAEIESIEYPKGESIKFPFADEPLPVYRGRVRIRITFKERPADVVRGTITYQPCTETECHQPVRRRFELA